MFPLLQVDVDCKWVLGVGLLLPSAQSLGSGSVGGGIFGCRVFGRPSGFALPLERFLAAGALSIHLQDHGFMAQAIDSGHGGGFIREQSVPCTERLIGGDHQ